MAIRHFINDELTDSEDRKLGQVHVRAMIQKLKKVDARIARKVAG